MAEKLAAESKESPESPVGSETEDNEGVINFIKGWDMSDLAFKTDDGTLVHVNKAILCHWSPVFKAMFTGDYKEKNEAIVKLPGKEAEDLIKFMAVLHPPPAPISGIVEYNTKST